MGDLEGEGRGAIDGAGSICIGCGLCCDGTLLSHLAVSDESDLGAPLRGLGVELIVAADPPVFELPCPAVSGGVCTIHHLHRPRACAQFECDLSRRVLDGEVDAGTARMVIAETVALRDAVRRSESDEASLAVQLRRHFRANI